MTNQTTAILYLRTASASDEAIAEQQGLCARYAEARGWRILDVVIDNGVSGMRDAPGLTILRDRIANGEAQVVIATDLARISRDPERAQAFARFCRQYGTTVCLVERTANLDATLSLDDGEGSFLHAFFAAQETRL